MTRILKEPVFWVDPKEIKYTANMWQHVCNVYGVPTTEKAYRSARDKVRETGFIDGEWDQNQRFFVQEPFLDALQVYENKGDWRATRAYQETVELYNNRAETVFKRWIDIYENIKKNGYSSPATSNPWNEYILVAVGRTGELLFYQGRHRLAMALNLGVKLIPVKVGIRHTIWHEFRESVLKYAQNHTDRIYSPIKHPDFATVTTKWSDYRGDLLLSHINPETKTVLDLGAHWGYFCDLLAQTGRQCVAVEKAPAMFYFLDMVSRLHNRAGFTAVNSGINEYLQQNNEPVDCVIALNIFHHFLKTKAGWESLVEVATRLQCKEMFFQMANDRTLGKFGNGWKKTADVLELLQTKTGLSVAKEIGVEHNRAIYHLKKA